MNLRMCFALILTLVSLAAYRPSTAFAQGKSIADVWALEDDYWRFVKAGDVENYVKLWHEKFIGWPCHEDHPVGKGSIGSWVREVREKKLKVEIGFTREGAEDFGDIVVVHYSFTRVDTHPDGRVEQRGRSKITHTWMRVGSTWQIIGGMCGSLTAPPSSGSAEKQVRATVAAFYAAFNAHDWSNAAEFATEDWIHINPLGGMTKGRATLQKELKEVHSTFLKGVKDTPEEDSVAFVGDETAVMTVVSRPTAFTTPDGVKHENEQHVRTFFLVRRDGRWLILLDQNTIRPPE